VRAALVLLGLLAAAAPAARAATATLVVDAVPAWQGWSRPGRSTELEIRLSARGDAAVTVASEVQRIVTAVAVSADRPARLRVPVAAAPTVTVSAVVDDGAPVAVTVALSLSESPLLAWVASREEPPPSVAGFRTLSLAPAALPGNASAYASIDALVISAVTLSALDEEQMVALLGHVATCGRTVLVGADPDTAALFAAGAGCGSRALGAVPDTASAGAALAGLLQQSPREPPRAGSLAALAGADLASWRVVLATLAGCAALLLLCAVFTSSLPLLVVLAGTLALAAAWFLQSRPTAARLAVWAEAGPGERLARYGALQRATVQRRGTAVVDLHAELAAPTACRERRDATWHWDAAQRRFARISVPGQLFDSVSLCYSGSFPVARSAAWHVADDGQAVLRNTGPSEWPAGQLLWRGTVRALPGVAPGAEVVLVTDAAESPANAVQRLALSRTSPNDAALLWPLDLGTVAGAPAQSQAWLLVAAGTTAAGESP
jgi:hypothetical protein